MNGNTKIGRNCHQEAGCTGMMLRGAQVGFHVMLVKEVDNKENTICFFQEVYDENGRLIEIHHKYPEDKGHQTV